MAGAAEAEATAACDAAACEADAAALLGLGDADELQAPATMANKPRIVTILRGPERV